MWLPVYIISIIKEKIKELESIALEIIQDETHREKKKDKLKWTEFQ